MATVEVNQMLAAAAAACEDKKAEDIRILALDPSESGLSDYFLICTGTNDRQTVAITDEIEIRLKRDFATYPNSVEGRRQGEWILMDYVDFIVHVFLPEKRAFYGLERLRKSATSLSMQDLNSEITAAIKAKRPAARKTASAPEDSVDKAPAKRTRAALAKKGTAAELDLEEDNTAQDDSGDAVSAETRPKVAKRSAKTTAAKTKSPVAKKASKKVPGKTAAKKTKAS